MKDLIRKKIINNAIKNLKEFGYDDVDEENLFNEYVVSEFFKSMLQHSIEENSNHIVDEVLQDLLSRLNKKITEGVK